MKKSAGLRRRQLLKTLGISMGAAALNGMLPAKWVKPAIRIGVLPAHAQTSDSQPGPQPHSPAFNITFEAGPQPEDDVFEPDSASGGGGIIDVSDTAFYYSWRLEIEGDKSGLSDPVPIRVTIDRGDLDSFLWFSYSDGASDFRSLNFPRDSIGTVGASGNVLNTIAVPQITGSTTGQEGVLTISATGVEELEVGFVYQPAAQP
jgi:hypothetical protein